MKLAQVALLLVASLVAVPVQAQSPGLTHYKDPLTDPETQRIMREASRQPVRQPRWIRGALAGHICSERRVDGQGRLLRDRRVFADGIVEETEYKPAGTLFRVVLHGPKGVLEATRFCGAGCGSRAGTQIIANGWPTPWAHEALMAGERERNGGQLDAQRSASVRAASVAAGRSARRRATGAAKVSTWDANGNLIGDSEGNQYQYDFDDRLTKVIKSDGAVIEHVYDADGNRVQTRVTPTTGPSQVTDFLVDSSGPLSHVVAETDEAGGLKTHYVRGDDLVAVMRPLVPAPTAPTDWQSRFFHADGVGSIRHLTNEAGQGTDTYAYTAFGEQTAHLGNDPQPYAFAGEPWDPNSGFQYHRARWMDPRVGRFLGMDPWPGATSDPPSLHRYVYARSEPATTLDPSGRTSDGRLSSLAMAMTYMVTLAAMHLPRMTTMLYTVADMLSPVELGLSPGQIGTGALRRASRQGGHQALRHLAATWRAWRTHGGTHATGTAFEVFIGRLLRPGARHHVGITDGVETGLKSGKAIPDWVDDAAQQVVEAKNTFSSVHYEQALEIGQYASNRGFVAHYVFLKRPTNKQLDDLAGWLAEGAERGGGSVEFRFSFLEP